MLKLGDIVSSTTNSNIKYVVIGFKDFTVQDTVFRLFKDNFIYNLYNSKAVLYPVKFLNEPLVTSYVKQKDSVNEFFKVTGHMDIKPFLIKTKMVTGTDLPFLDDNGVKTKIKKPLSIVKELESRLKEYPENEIYRYVNIFNKNEIMGSRFVDELNYFIDNDFNVLYFKDYKFYMVGQIKGKTLFDRYFNLLTHEYEEFRDGTVIEYETKTDFYFQKKNKIFNYNDYMLTT